MDCRGFRKLVGRSIDGEAVGADAASFEAHLSECPECARLYGDLAALASVHARMRDLEPPADLTGRIVAAARAAGASSAPAGPGRAWKAVVAAAAAAVILLGIYTGSFIMRAFVQAPAPRYAEVTGLEYLDDYPPASLGEAIEVAAGGAHDE